MNAPNFTLYGGPGARPAEHEDTDAGAAWAAAVGGGPAAILDKINHKLPPEADRDEAIARKHNCRSVWCPTCYRRFHLQRHFERLSEIPWREARFVTLTLDREKVGIGADAYVWLREKKALGRFIVRLKKIYPGVKDWAGQMEFHRDGTPHFHILIHTQAGPKGQIGNSKLLKAWPFGFAREEYFKTEADWNRTVGYFGKAGYFHKGKQYQTELPDYFFSEYFKGMKIPRFYSARQVTPGERLQTIKTEPKSKLESLTSQRVKSCGRQTIIFSLKPDEWGVFPQSQESYLTTLDVPYSYFKVMMAGHYNPGRGFQFYLSGEPPDIPACPY